MAERRSEGARARGVTAQPATCVVLCHWVGDPQRNLHRLLGRLQRVEAGSPFDLVIVCNGGVDQPLVLPPHLADPAIRIIDRENEGYNLAAWERGWRESPGYRFYLFLQDECEPRDRGWLSAYERRMAEDPGIGLLGEHVAWDRLAWDEVRVSTARDRGEAVARQVDCYRSLLADAGIPEGDTASHLQSTVLFTSRKILEEIDGIPHLGPSYREAVAAEIGVSRLIASRGYRISRVADGSYAVVGHRQRSRTGTTTRRYQLRRKLQAGLRALLPRSARGFLKERFPKALR